MARIDQNTSLPTYSYRSLDGKTTGPRKAKLLKNIVTILLIVFLSGLLLIKYTSLFGSSSSIPGFPVFFKKTTSSADNIPRFTSTSKPTENKDSSRPVSISKPQNPAKIEDKKLTSKPTSNGGASGKFKTGSPLDAFLSGFVDPSVASQMLKFVAQQAIDPIVFNVAPVLDKLLPPERIDLILRTTDSISSGELSGFDAIRKNFQSIAESLFLLIFNLAPSLGESFADDLLAICDYLSDWMEHTDLSISKHLGWAIAHGILPLMGYSDAALEQASRIFENGISQLLPDASLVDPSVFKSKEKLKKLLPSISQIQPVIMSIFVQMASLRALQASVSSFSSTPKGGKQKEHASASSTTTTTTTNTSGEGKRASSSKHRRRRSHGSSDSDDANSYFDN